MAFAVTGSRPPDGSLGAGEGPGLPAPSAWQVKRLLTEGRVPAASATAIFVGVEAYEAAGGSVTRELFAEEDDRGMWLDDPALLQDLAMAKLRAAADELASRWKWTEAVLEMDWSATARFGRVQPQPAEPTEEERAEIERLCGREDELTNLDDGDWTEELVAEASTCWKLPRASEKPPTKVWVATRRRLTSRR